MVRKCQQRKSSAVSESMGANGSCLEQNLSFDTPEKDCWMGGRKKGRGGGKKDLL